MRHVFTVFFMVFACDFVLGQAPPLRVEFSTRQTKTGTETEIIESVKELGLLDVRVISHQAKRIGFYHRGHKRFVRWHDGQRVSSRSDELLKSHLAPHGIELTRMPDGRLSKRFSFSVADPGIYVITVKWGFAARGEFGKTQFEREVTSDLLFVTPSPAYERDAAKQNSDFSGLRFQASLEKQYDENPSEVGVLLQQLDELSLEN